LDSDAAPRRRPRNAAKARRAADRQSDLLGTVIGLAHGASLISVITLF
jgi:hypothetical protein